MRKLTEYTWHTGKLAKPVHLLVISDLHDEPYEDLFAYYPRADLVLVPGDIVSRYVQSSNTGLAFLRDSARRLPTFYSYGNHEYSLEAFDGFTREAAETGAVILHNRYVRHGELVIGGWYWPRSRSGERRLAAKPAFLPAMEREEGCKVLLCHRPEDYVRYLAQADIDLAVGGHAHGGQIRVFGHGLYAPGQGLWPKYTRGRVGEKMLVSAGASNPVRMPRWGNPCEVLLVHLD